MKTYFLQVKEVSQETSEAVNIAFWHPISEQIKYKAGQFITVTVPGMDGKKVKRSYSMSSSPNADTAVTISIKKVQNGYVSNYLNTQVKAGDFLEVIEPMGNFYVEPDTNKRNVYLIAAGSGITPLFSILKTILKGESDSKIHLLYGNKTADQTMFKATLDELGQQNADRLTVKYIFSQEGETARINTEIFSNWLNDTPSNNTDAFYMCGPEAMMDAVRAVLESKGIQKDNVHYERFNAPVLDTEEAAEEGVKMQMVTIKYDGQTHEIVVPPHKTILEAALELDIDLPYSCQAGMCTACLGKCTSGKILMDEEDGLTEKEIKEGYVLTCVSHPLTAGVVLEIE
jgi:ring-1,2-phenylacetyl-CoA epoxidase subunit PaaE